MKRLTLFMALIVSCSWLAEPCQTQSLDEQIQNIFLPLNKSEVQSGILIQQTPVFLWPGRFDGRNMADSMSLSLDRFGFLYGQFRGAAVGQSFLPHPEIYLNQRESDTVKLACMAIQYDFIRKGALEDSLLIWHNGQVYDVPGRSESPYRQDTCFAMTVLQQELKGQSFKYILPRELVFTNMDWNIERIQIDFDDGLGFRSCLVDKAIEVNYATSGEKTIRLQYHYNGKRFNMATFLKVELPVFGGNRDSSPYDRNNPEIVYFVGDSISVFSACDDGKVRRPLIVLEGFAGENFTSKSMFDLLDEGETSDDEPIILNDYLNTNEYDLIYVDYKNSYLSIETNADNFIEVIDWVNARKHADGSSEPNVVIGNSMGGLVAKLALLKMHNEEGKDSEVERFFSFDSPFKGANLPIGIQAFIRDFVNMAESVGVSTASFANALALLDADAAQELLKYRVVASGSTFTFDNSRFDQLQNRIDQLELIRPLNAITRHIAMSNGANFGTLQESFPTSSPTVPIFSKNSILTFGFNIDEVDPDDFGGDGSCLFGFFEECPEIFYNLIVSANAWAATGETTLIYHREIKINPIIGGDNIISHTDFILNEPLTLDDAPGSMTAIGLADIKRGMRIITDEIVGEYEVNDVDTIIWINSFCFVPTVSSLDMPLQTAPEIPTPTGGNSVHRWSVSEDNTVTSPYSDLGEFNQEHVSINTRIADLIVSELGPDLSASLSGPLLAGEVYNFGREPTTNTNLGVIETPGSISDDLIIQNGAELWVNRNDILGYNDSGNPVNANPQAFVVTVPGADCDDTKEADVTIQSGGKIVIGDFENGILNTGQLYFGKNSTLVVNGIEGLEIDKHSSLAIAGGATMTINPGASVFAKDFSNIKVDGGSELKVEPNGILELIKGAKCTVGNNARMHIKQGARLRLSEGAQIVVDSGGVLEIDPNANIDLFWHASNIHVKEGGELIYNGIFNFDGFGYFQFDKDHIFTQNAKLVLSGQDDRFIRLNDGAVLNISHHGIDLRNGEVEYRANASIRTAPGAGVHIENMRFEGIDYEPAYNIALLIKEAPNVTVIQSEFENLDRAYP